MSESTNDTAKPETSFAELFSQGPKAAKEGEVARGRILSVDEEFVQVDIGFKSEGLVAAWEFMEDDGTMTVKVGDIVDVLVEDAEDEDGRIVLSKEKAERLKIWDEISLAYDEDRSVEGTIIARVKGGLSVDIGVKAFLPGSQVDLRPVRNLDALRGQELRMRVIKVNKKRGNIVLSRKALLEEENAEKKKHTLATLERHPESVPVNALVPVKGTVLGDMLADTPLAKIDDIEFVRTVAVARICMPMSMVRLSAGRESMSEATQALCFLAGANSIFTGDKLLTAPNAGDDSDGALFAKLGLTAMQGEEPMRACRVEQSMEPAE